MPGLGASRHPTAPLRIVSVRRRSPVALSVHVPPAPDETEAFAVEVCAGGRPIATLAVDVEAAAALACLLRQPAWLLIVAVEIPTGVVGRLWALVPAPADGRAKPQAQPELADDDLVYAFPLADLAVIPAARAHPDDVVAEVRHLLGTLAAGAA
jgi:hypothetical protein